MELIIIIIINWSELSPAPRLIYFSTLRLSNSVVALNNAMEQWSYSNCDGSYFNCNVVKGGALTIAGVDQ